MSAAEFLAWEQGQEDRYELVDGQPQMMAGGSHAHHVIAMNIATALRLRLRSGPCTPLLERKVFTPLGNYRYPDVMVECGRPPLNASAAQEPKVVFEVESPSNSDMEAIGRFEDYQSTPAIQAIVFVSQSKALARLYQRVGERWESREFAGFDASLPLEALGCALPLAEVYEGLKEALAGV